MAFQGRRRWIEKAREGEANVATLARTWSRKSVFLKERGFESGPAVWRRQLRGRAKLRHIPFKPTTYIMPNLMALET